MKIYTSYFAMGKSLAKNGIMQIGIALNPPQWYRGVSMKMVAPSYSILYKKDQTDEEYTKRYCREILGTLNPQQVLQAINQLSGGKDVALCCFEKPEDFCHRHLLAKWLTQHTGVEIEEFRVQEKKLPEEKSLFDDF